ncbi:hypothetical protein IT411_03395 [Candidatus Peregrinibacteria bacterium]|nr:hypothetical protein [Candidatus Peregrinibacteria bacterium]
MSKPKLKLLILLNFTWSILGFFADYNWLAEVPVWLIPLTCICSLYPPLLTIWYLLKYYGKTTPNWFTFWVVLGTASYGFIAQIYFPLLMSWKGVNFHDIGSMFWVAVYGFQSILLFRYLKPLKPSDLAPALIYLFTADAFHYFYPTFVDFILPNYPNWLKLTTGLTAITVQIIFALLIVYLLRRRAGRSS